MYDPIKILQVVGNISTSATSLSATLVGGPQAGSVLAVFVFTDAVNSAISLSTMTGQAWTKVLGVDGSAVACGIVVYELAHMPKAPNDDGHSNALVSTNSVTTWTCGSVTPTVGCGISFTWYCDTGTGAITNPTGYSTDTNSTQTAASERLIVARKIKTDAAAESAVWTNGTSITSGFAGEVLLAPSLFPDVDPARFIYLRGNDL